MKILQQYQAFLATHIAANPGILVRVFGSTNGSMINQFASQMHNWEVEEVITLREYIADYLNDAKKINVYHGDHLISIKASTLKFVRPMTLRDSLFDGAGDMGFPIYEDAQGVLYVGEYAGV